MTVHLNLDDTRSIEAKIGEKAYDLFKAKPGKPQLQVSRLPETELGEGEAAVLPIGNQHIKGLSQLKALEHVWEFDIYTSDPNPLYH
jgi:hypothetical protein